MLFLRAFYTKVFLYKAFFLDFLKTQFRRKQNVKFSLAFVYSNEQQYIFTSGAIKLGKALNRLREHKFPAFCSSRQREVRGYGAGY